MERLSVLAVLILPGLLAAQESRRSATYTYDLDGRPNVFTTSRVADAPGAVSSVVGIPNINNGFVPYERVEEKVLRDDASGRVVERVVKPFDQNGQPLPPRKTRIEEDRHAGGRTTIRSTVLQADVNGNFKIRERTTTEKRVADSVETESTVIERPSLEGSLQVAEKVSSSAREAGGVVRQDVVTYRKDASGNFYAAARQDIERVESNGVSMQTVVEYATYGLRALQLEGKRVEKAAKQADGSVVKEVDLYGVNLPGRATESGPREPVLREQQLIVTQPGPGNTVVETFSVRRPSLDPSAKLGAYQKIAETVCTGCEIK